MATAFLFSSEHILGEGGIDIVEFFAVGVCESGFLVNGLDAGEEVVGVAKFPKAVEIMSASAIVFTEKFPWKMGGDVFRCERLK